MKRIPRPEPAAAEAAQVGDELRIARLALGVSLEEVSAELRIRRSYLAALEEGRVQDLPGVAYAVGFVRTYALALGLEADELVRRFREATGGPARRQTDLVFPEPVPERGMPAGAVVLLGAVLALGAYVGWYNWSGSGDRIVDNVPPLPSRLERAAEGAAARASLAEARPEAQQNPAEAPASDAPVSTAAVPLPTVSAPAVVSTPMPVVTAAGTAEARGTVAAVALPPGSGQVPMPTPPSSSASATNAAQAATVPVAPLAPPPPTAEPAMSRAQVQVTAPRVQLRARDESWVQVRDPRSGQVLFNRLMRGGETANIPQREGLLLITGKAENLDILVDGEVSPVLEGITGVRRDIPLDPDRLRAAPATAEGQQGA